MTKILVEDNEMNRDMLSRRLQRNCTRRLKAAPETRAIPVIALTAHAMTTDRDKALSAGCDDFDTKPIELPRLLSKIEALLAGHRAP